MSPPDNILLNNIYSFPQQYQFGHFIYCPHHKNQIVQQNMSIRLAASHLLSSYPWKTWIDSFGISNSFNSFDAVLLKPRGPHTRTRGQAPKEAMQGARMSLLTLPFFPVHSSCSDSTCSTLTCVNFSKSSLQGMSCSFLLKRRRFAG